MENNSLNFDNYLFRCSSLGKLMVGVKPKLTERQSKELDRLNELRVKGKITEKQCVTLADYVEKRDAPDELAKTVKTYLEKIHKEILFKRSSELRSKYCDKGIQVEEKSISLYSDVNKKAFFKNKERFYNEYITGEPDNKNAKVRDIKSSWDYETFPFYETEITNNDYDLQLFGYEWLTKLHEAELIYCLIDTPIKIINDEIRRLDWKENIFTQDGEIRPEKQALAVELIQSMIYTSEGLEEFCNYNANFPIRWFDGFRPVPETLRVKVFNHSFDETKVEMVIGQIKKCREYLNSLSEQIADKLQLIANELEVA